MPRRIAPLLLAVAVLAVGVLPWLPAGAATTTVEVRDGGYEPGSITVRVGDRVTWSWVTSQPHSVTSLDDGASFDSHPDCAVGAPEACGTAPHTFSWTPQTTGSYGYGSRSAPGMVGTVVVEEAPASSPSPSASPDPEPDPEPSDPAPTRTTAPPDADPDPEPEDDASPSPRPTPTRGRASGPAIGTAGTPTPSPTAAEEPAVATAGPGRSQPLEPFPSASPIPSPGTDTVTLTADGGGPGPRTWWLGIGSASVLAAAGAFGKLVLFGPPWR